LPDATFDAMQHETHAADISIHLIGRFRITSGDRVAIDGAWSRRKPLALVKLLALQPNRSLHRDVIFDALWPDLSPTAAGNNLRQSLHQLRNALAEAGLAAPMVRSVGDSLAIAPEIDIDLERFRAAAEQARAVRTDTAAYDRALKLCAGDLLPDDQYEPWVERDRADVQTLQTQLLMELSRLHLARRDTEQAEGCFRRVVAADPANEEAHRALMHLYAQTGLRTRALRQYDRCRDALEEELGVKPSEETLEVAQEILRGRTSASVSGASGRDTPFVGRQRELDTLCSYVDEGLAGNGRVVLVGGEPGVGKTRAAEELATYARMRGALVCWGRCYDAEGAPAYWPWSQVVREYVEGRDGSEVRDVVGTGGPELAQVFPELRDTLAGSVQAQPAADPEQARFRLFSAVATFFENVARRRPLVIVIDDLHTADPPSLMLLRFVTREIRDARIIVVATYRDTELRGNQPLGDALAALVREPVVRSATLAGLTRAQVGQYLMLVTGTDAPSALASDIHRRTGGNAFFVTELVRLLAENGDPASLLADTAHGDSRECPWGRGDACSRS
jgi:DNA-binding SARP family transcriptional activator